LLRLCTRVGAPSVRTFIGFQTERYDPNVAWQQMLGDTVEFLKRLAPLVRDCGLKLGLETHQDATTFELLRVIESVGSDVVGITLDTANLPMRVEDPLEATKRVAPFVVMTHTKDSILFFGDDGLRWQTRPCGQGAMPLTEMIPLLPDDVMLSIEDHPRIYPIPIFDREWLSSYTDLTAQELAALVRLARETEKRIASSELGNPQQEETVSWEEKVGRRLNDSVRFLKGLRDRQ
jgi:sugar phosphate isomerase/epimerase